MNLPKNNIQDVGNEQEQVQVIVFKIGREEYGLFIDQIKEVVLTPNVTEVPEVENHIKGVANIRGNIIAIIDLEERFKVLKKESNELGKYVLVVASEEHKLGILVQEMPNTLTILKNQIEESKNIIGENISESKYINGIIKLEERLIILIDIYKVINPYEVESIAQ